MMTTGTITLLSACNSLHANNAAATTLSSFYPESPSTRLSLSRHQIRLSLGCLMAMAQVWPQGKRHLAEVQAIAREVLGIGESGAAAAVAAAVAVPKGFDTTTTTVRQQQDGIHDNPNNLTVLPDDGLDGLVDLSSTFSTDSFWFSAFFSSEEFVAG